MWIGGVGGAELVTLSYVLNGGVGEVRDVIRNVAGGNEMFGGGEEDFAKLDFPGTRGGGWLKKSKCLLSFPSEGLPVRFPQVGEGDAGDLGGLRGEGPPKMDEYGEVVRVECGEGSPLEVGGYFGGGYGQVWGGGVPMGRESGGCVKVEEDKVSGY